MPEDSTCCGTNTSWYPPCLWHQASTVRPDKCWVCGHMGACDGVQGKFMAAS